MTTTQLDKQHTLWLHGNTLLKPMHSIAPPPQIASEYAEVTQTMMPKIINISAPPEPYATVTLQRGAQSDDSCVKCSASPSSSEYNAPVREPLNICDVLPPPPDHPYGAYKPPSNMTIRTNPVAMSPQIGRRVPATPPRWGTLPPPIPNFPQNWPEHAHNNPNLINSNLINPNQDYYVENDYESGSVLYEQCCRPDEQAANYFNRGGEPTEEYYRNINMEYLDDQEFEPSTPPPPCPDPYNAARLNSNLRLINSGNNLNHQQQQQAQSQHQHQQQQQTQQVLQSDQSPVNSRRPSRNENNSNRTALSSDESESDNSRWAPRTRRSRSKSGDRKFRNGSGYIR